MATAITGIIVGTTTDSKENINIGYGTKMDDTSCKSGGFMLMCKASPGNPWHNFVSDTDRWVDDTGSTPCLNNGGIYPIASQYASIATMVSNGAQTIFTTSANATFLGTPLPSKLCGLTKYHTRAVITFEF